MARTQRTFTISMASGGTTTAQLDLATDAFENVYIKLPTFNSSCAHYVQGCEVSSGTFARVFFPGVASSPTNNYAFNIATGVSNCFVPIPNGIRFIKIETDKTVDNGCTYQIVCGG